MTLSHLDRKRHFLVISHELNRAPLIYLYVYGGCHEKNTP